ncbi:MAG: OsmC family peroxiredoxin, partial [Bacteroidales bacterium]|nr:OsmC family peroxiredoxin [Bacteroidales bacterium]
LATSIEFDLEEATVNAEGDIDFRGTLAVDRAVPVGFKEFRIKTILKTKETDERIATLLKLTERYCIVHQTLTKANKSSIEHVRI